MLRGPIIIISTKFRVGQGQVCEEEIANKRRKKFSRSPIGERKTNRDSREFRAIAVTKHFVNAVRLPAICARID